jgi:hypothetical protein
MLLTCDEEVAHLPAEDIEDINCIASNKFTAIRCDRKRTRTSENPYTDEMCPIARLVARVDIPEGKLHKTVLCDFDRIPSVNAADGKENSPAKNPNGYEDFEHHAQEPDEKIRVETIVFDDFSKVSVDKSHGP